jgi:translation initiation factor 2B subunit (eIF-2B alpha/beta/delta family)
MMMTETTRAKKLVKLLERLIKQDHLYTDDKVREMKAQLRAVKEEIAQLEAQTFKGFGKK